MNCLISKINVDNFKSKIILKSKVFIGLTNSQLIANLSVAVNSEIECIITFEEAFIKTTTIS